MSAETNRADGARKTRNLLIFGMIAAVFFTSYAFAIAKTRGGAAQPAFETYGAAQAGDAYGDQYAGGAGGAGGSGAGGGGCGMGCCGGGGPAVEGTTTVAGDVQTIDVDTSSGSFNPNVIKAKAGVPFEIAFSQAPGGCLAGVYFPDFGINEDLTAGGKTIELPALEPGEYTFYCQMQMVSAKIVVE